MRGQAKGKSRYKHQDWDLTCDMCGRAFTEQQSLHRHLAVKHGTVVGSVQEASHACPSCSQTFETESALCEHGFACHADAATSVRAETEIADSVNTAAQNDIICVGDNKTICDICRQSFDNVACLARHLLEEHSGRPKGESRKRKEKTGVTTGKMKNRSTDESSSSSCQLPDSESSISSTSRGIVAESNTSGFTQASTSDQQSNQCGLCDMFFTTEDELQHHNLLRHNTVSIYKKRRSPISFTECEPIGACKDCGELISCSTPGVMERHYAVAHSNTDIGHGTVEVQTDPRNMSPGPSHVCPFCNQTFATAVALSTHRNTAHETTFAQKPSQAEAKAGKKTICAKCWRSFDDYTCLRRHLRSRECWKRRTRGGNSSGANNSIPSRRMRQIDNPNQAVALPSDERNVSTVLDSSSPSVIESVEDMSISEFTDDNDPYRSKNEHRKHEHVRLGTECPVCKKWYSFPRDARDHIVRDHSLELTGTQFTVQCPVPNYSSSVSCDKSFHSYDSIYRHLRSRSCSSGKANELAVKHLPAIRECAHYRQILRIAGVGSNDWPAAVEVETRLSDNRNSCLSDVHAVRREQQMENARDAEKETVISSRATTSQAPSDVRRTCAPYTPMIDASDVLRHYNKSESSLSAAQVCPPPGPSTEAGSSMLIPTTSLPACYNSLSPSRGSVSELMPSESDPEEIIQCLYCHFTSRQSDAIRSHYFQHHSDDGPEYSSLDRYLLVQDQKIRKIKEQKRELEVIKERLDQQQRMFNERLDEQSRIVQQQLDQVDEKIQYTLLSKQNVLSVSEQNTPVSSTIHDEVYNEPDHIRKIALVPDPPMTETLKDIGEKTFVKPPDFTTLRSTPSSTSQHCADTSKLRCRICSESFGYEKAFIKHVRKRHSVYLKSRQKKYSSSVRTVSDASSMASSVLTLDTQWNEFCPKKKRKCETNTEVELGRTAATLTLEKSETSLYSKWKLKPCSVKVVDCLRASSCSASLSERKRTFQKKVSSLMQGAGKAERNSVFIDTAVVEHMDENHQTMFLAPPPSSLASDCEAGTDSDHAKILDHKIDLDPNPRSDFESDDNADMECPVCNKTLLDEISIKDHIVAEHSRTISGEQYLMRCPGCEFSAATYMATYTHILQEHGADEEALAELQMERESHEYQQIVSVGYQLAGRRHSSCASQF